MLRQQQQQQHVGQRGGDAAVHSRTVAYGRTRSSVLLSTSTRCCRYFRCTSSSVCVPFFLLRCVCSLGSIDGSSTFVTTGREFFATFWHVATDIRHNVKIYHHHHHHHPTACRGARRAPVSLFLILLFLVFHRSADPRDPFYFSTPFPRYVSL